VKEHIIENNLATTEAREKISADLESLEFLICVKLYLKAIKIYFKKLATDT